MSYIFFCSCLNEKTLFTNRFKFIDLTLPDYLSMRYLVRPVKLLAEGEVSSILFIMCLKTIILFLLAVCFVIINEASKEDFNTVNVTIDNLEIQSKRISTKLQKNHETLKDAFKSIGRKQRTVPSKYYCVKSNDA